MRCSICLHMIDNSMDSDKQKLLGYDDLCVLRRGSRGGGRVAKARVIGIAAH